MHQWGEVDSVDKKDICTRIREKTTKFVEINSGNFDKTMKEIKNIKIEGNELRNSITFTEKILEEKVQTMQRKIGSFEGKVEEIMIIR